jgi:DNA modification methylase
MSKIDLHHGDCREVLRALPESSVHCVVTSPPYFGLRDYGVEGQIGLEQTPDEYVAEMVAVFREVRRVLRDDGTLWLNLGDSYAANRSYQVTPTKHRSLDFGRSNATKVPDGLKPKDLIGIPWRVAFALQQPYERVRIKDRIDRAWLAALIDGEGCITALECKSGHGSGNSYPPILQVRMCDPEPIIRCCEITGYGKGSPKQEPPSQGGQRGSYQWRIHGRKAADILAEIYPYLLIKRKQAVVAYNLQTVRDSYETKRGAKIPEDALTKQLLCREILQKLNARENVDLPSWMVEPSISVEPGFYLRQDVIWHKPNTLPESVRDRCTKAHEYIFLLSKSPRYYFDSDAIKEPAIHAGVTVKSRGKYDDGTGKAITGYETHVVGERLVADKRNRRSVWTVTTKPFKGAHFATFPPDLIEPCILAGCPEGGTVLDPFNGAGTTGLVCQRLGRNYVGIELNGEYLALTRRRLGLSEMATDTSCDGVFG